jgi:N-methylhydantoinase B
MSYLHEIRVHMFVGPSFCRLLLSRRHAPDVLALTRGIGTATDAAFYELEIVRGRLQATVDEAGAALLRTAFSNVVREAHDFACAILTPEGHTVVQSQQSIPVFIGTMGSTWRAMKSLYTGFANLRPGDVLATNDPWIGTGQLNDITMMAPVFIGDRVIGFAGVVAHHTDIGGRGHIIGGSAQVFEEGLRLPVLKLGSASGLDPTIADIIAWNVRLPNEALGDLNAMLNGAAVISKRLASLASELGSDRLLEMCRELESRAEAFMRQAVSQVPDGTYRSRMNSVGGPNAPFSIDLQIEVMADAMVLDLDGTPEVSEGINSTYPYTYAYAMYGCKCLLAPELPFNDGLFRPMTLRAREGTVVNCRFPAPTSGRSTIGHHLPMLIFNALTEAMPEATIAECGNPQPILSLRGTHPDTGAMFATSLSAFGGYGARAHKDGIAAFSFPTNVTAVSAEVMEMYSPLMFIERELICDSGGPGTNRGGLGQRIAVRLLADQADAYARAQWVTRGPRGVRRGSAGGRTSVRVNGKKVPRLARSITLRRDDIATVESAGGGGYGPARRRSRAAVLDDVRLGYVSPAQARGVYGLNEPAEGRNGDEGQPRQ